MHIKRVITLAENPTKKYIFIFKIDWRMLIKNSHRRQSFYIKISKFYVFYYRSDKAYFIIKIGPFLKSITACLNKKLEGISKSVFSTKI